MGNQYKASYTKPATNNNTSNLASSSDIAGEVTLKTSVDGYQLLKMNEFIKNAAAWRARMPKASMFNKYFNNKDNPTNTSTPKVQINETTLAVMGEAAKDFGYTKEEFIEAVEMYEHFGNVNLEDVPAPSLCTIPVPVIKLCLSAIFVRNINSSELHFQCSTEVTVQ